MKTNSTAIAACVHCRTILVCARQVFFHPLAEERDSVQKMLGNYWFHHSRTRFDGQFHRCAGGSHEHRQVPLLTTPGRDIVGVHQGLMAPRYGRRRPWTTSIAPA